jgi:hypothetical protein
MKRSYTHSFWAAAAFAIICYASDAAIVTEVSDVAPVWAGHPVGFSLLTAGDDQYVAYYDAERRMAVAHRQLTDGGWRFVVLPETVGWDSHNSVTIALDSAGDLHLSGNMHVHPLVYFRTRIEGNIESLERIPAMTGQEEDRVTYPRFFEAPDGSLVFTYRDGSSGSGNQIFNVYDVVSQQWRRLLDRPLTDGEGKMNAYPVGPGVGPDGYYHVCWVWRDTPDCATNHDLCYARSKDLVQWETAGGEPLTLPITLANAEVVDPVPPGGGIINGNTRVGFDSQQRPVIAYHKFDEAGKTQVYNARYEQDRWVIYQTSEWDYRWEFSGGGSIGFEIGVSPVVYKPETGLTQGFRTKHVGSGVWVLNEETLQIEETKAAEDPLPSEVRRLRSAFPGMTVRWSSDLGSSPAGGRYVLRWETLGQNRDRPRKQPWPEPSQLQVIRLED